MANSNEIIVYQPNETIRLDVRLEGETVWLSQAQMVILFQRDQSVIARHIANAFREGEVDRGSNMHFLHIPFSDKPVAFYSLDVIISVGYRIKSIVGTRFRQWATRILRDRLLRSVSENARLASLERRMDDGFARQGQRIKKLENEVSVFVKTALPPVEGVLFEGQICDAYTTAMKIIKSARQSIFPVCHSPRQGNKDFTHSPPLPRARAVWYNSCVPMKGGEARPDSDR